MKKIKLLIAAIFISASISTYALAQEDFIVTTYGFATDGFNFYVDETGYMTLAAGLEAQFIALRGHPLAQKGQDLTAQSNVPLGWDGDYYRVNGNGQVDTLADTFKDGQKITVYFTGNATIRHNIPSSKGKASMRLKDSQDAQGPILIGFVKDGPLWIETNRTPF